MVAVDTERKAAKTKETVQAFAAATEAVNMKQYAYADRLLAQIDDTALPADKQDEAKKVLSIAVCDHYNHVRHLRTLRAEDAERAMRAHISQGLEALIELNAHFDP